MKFIKNHIMFILPLLTILLGVEFYLVFERTTNSYEQRLKDGYSMLVVTKKPTTLNNLKKLNKHISSIEKIKRKSIVEEIAKGMSENSTHDILASLPHFYSIRLDSYMSTSGLENIKHDLQKSQNVKSVETFGSSYSSSYRLFSFIKLLLAIFIGFMIIVSLLLVIKQMEIWKYTHIQRMQVMEIFGAPVMLRSAILFKIAIIDAWVATFITSLIFVYIKFGWASTSGIYTMVQNQDQLFKFSDILILSIVSLSIVIMSVAIVVFASKGVEE